MRFKLKFWLLFFLFFLISGCSLNKNKAYQESFEPEVLIAQECGLEGLRCCLENDEEKCQYGLECCLDPGNAENSFCASSCNQGQKNNFCRNTEPRCDDSLACQDNFCVECGIYGNPCCQNNPKCQKSENSQDLVECINEICSFCGADGEIPCPSSGQCLDGHLLNNNECFLCGALNKPCCKKDNQTYCDNGLKCNLGFCS